MYVLSLTNFGIAGDILPLLALERGSDINMSVSPALAASRPPAGPCRTGQPCSWSD